MFFRLCILFWVFCTAHLKVTVGTNEQTTIRTDYVTTFLSSNCIFEIFFCFVGRHVSNILHISTKINGIAKEWTQLLKSIWCIEYTFTQNPSVTEFCSQFVCRTSEPNAYSFIQNIFGVRGPWTMLIIMYWECVKFCKNSM